ncbi:MAG TPA: ATP-binding protein [Rhizomicrobium sp.]|nr:ATP-binding protein [Rhizomicrobium sp.]
MDLRPEQETGLRSAQVAGGALLLVLNNTLTAVEDGRNEILRHLGPLDPLVRNRLEVLFEELVSNTIRHGFAKHSAQSIHVQVKRTPGAVELTFEDDGVPFNLLEAQPPEPFTSIETARVGGLGIPLIVKMASALRYERPAPTSCTGFRPSNRTIISIAT